MVGSRCNLQCIHCYVESSPANDSLEQLTLEDIRRFLNEGAVYGVREIYFTGGEPFLNREILPMLQESLEVAAVSVLTNGTSPIHRYLDELGALHHRSPGRLALRISLDHYQESRHDAIRGKGNFRSTVDHATALAQAGLPVIITVTPEVFRGHALSEPQAVEIFRRLFAERGVSVGVKVLPAVLEMGAHRLRMDRPSEIPLLTEERVQALGVEREGLMCHTGRSVLKKDGACRVYPCPIIYEVPEYELGRTLADSFRTSVALAHPACALYCCRGGESVGSCNN